MHKKIDWRRVKQLTIDGKQVSEYILDGKKVWPSDIKNFICVGADGVSTSTSLQGPWSKISTKGPMTYVLDVIQAFGAFYCIGYDSYGFYIKRSTDGVSWNTLYTASTSYQYGAFLYNRGALIATVGTGAQTYILKSTDGETFTYCSTPSVDRYYSLQHRLWFDGTYYWIASFYNTGSYLYYSPDLVSWTKYPYQLQGEVYFNDGNVFITSQGKYTITDLTAPAIFNQGSMPSTPTYGNIVKFDGKYVTVFYVSSNYYFYYSDNGYSWIRSYSMGSSTRYPFYRSRAIYTDGEVVAANHNEGGARVTNLDDIIKSVSTGVQFGVICDYV